MHYVLYNVKPFVGGETQLQIEIIIQCEYNVNNSLAMVVTIEIYVSV